MSGILIDFAEGIAIGVGVGAGVIVLIIFAALVGWSNSGSH